MTSSIQRYCRQLPATKQLRRMELAECLKRLGLKPTQRVGGTFCFRVYKLDEWELQDLFNAAHAFYRKMMTVLHPDTGTDGKWCSRLTELWARIKMLFRRKGIET